uniref:Uncharacterized protein n=1 Tax=Myoviridae sp. ctJfU3 TaxID=2826638 RepID=A0A8S5MNL5_9CAUD|nr:MAG TPA: hypothetical protein [Myoviridae sp. ctJfU3]
MRYKKPCKSRAHRRGVKYAGKYNDNAREN